MLLVSYDTTGDLRICINFSFVYFHYFTCKYESVRRCRFPTKLYVCFRFQWDTDSAFWFRKLINIRTGDVLLNTLDSHLSHVQHLELLSSSLSAMMLLWFCLDADELSCCIDEWRLGWCHRDNLRGLKWQPCWLVAAIPVEVA